MVQCWENEVGEVGDRGFADHAPGKDLSRRRKPNLMGKGGRT